MMKNPTVLPYLRDRANLKPRFEKALRQDVMYTVKSNGLSIIQFFAICQPYALMIVSTRCNTYHVSTAMKNSLANEGLREQSVATTSDPS